MRSRFFFVALSVLALALARPVSADDAQEFYRGHFFLSGELLRAAYVCPEHSKENTRVTFESIAYPELRTIAHSFPKLTSKWMGDGADNFNAGIMTDGLASACKHADEMRSQMDALDKEHPADRKPK
jgi:hypothetical protein